MSSFRRQPLINGIWLSLRTRCTPHLCPLVPITYSTHVNIQLLLTVRVAHIQGHSYRTVGTPIFNTNLFNPLARTTLYLTNKNFIIRRLGCGAV